jgi:hypothetical protein
MSILCPSLTATYCNVKISTYEEYPRVRALRSQAPQVHYALHLDGTSAVRLPVTCVQPRMVPQAGLVCSFYGGPRMHVSLFEMDIGFSILRVHGLNVIHSTALLTNQLKHPGVCFHNVNTT